MTTSTTPESLPQILVVQHAELEHLGTLEPCLASVSRLRLMLAYGNVENYARTVDRIVREGAYDALIVLGGAMSLLERDVHQSLNETTRLLRAFLRRDVPVLGIGLGAQALAWSLGGQVWAGRTRGRSREMGWYPISLTPRGRVDPAFRGFREIDSVLHWHADSFDLPSGAWRLAETDLYANQAFRWGRWAYGVQFHMEVTGQMVADWVDSRGDHLAGMKRVDPDILVAKAVRYCPLLKPRVETLTAFFVECVNTARTEKQRAYIRSTGEK
ncbi:MAG: C26 family cysteine hydrolase domain-containing family [Actinobacteria bacterium]|nr:C26 family cysteine hydrolase domain-containing family [Actinomycetota bacterium]